MLVLGRKVGERILIDGGIELEVLEITGSRVRLGIAAPRQCQIIRAELAPAAGPLPTFPVVTPPQIAAIAVPPNPQKCLV